MIDPKNFEDAQALTPATPQKNRLLRFYGVFYGNITRESHDLITSRDK